LKTNPNIDAYWLQPKDEIPFEKLGEYWKKLETQFDKLLNFSGSIEGRLLLSPQTREYWDPKEKRHKLCNKNYYDHTMTWAGYPKAKGEIGELHFTDEEEWWAKNQLNQYPGFTVVWCLTGSAIHKIYPYADSVIQAIIQGIPEAHVLLVGEPGSRGIIDPHERIHDVCGEIDIRQSFALTKYVDLVVSTETSVLVAAGCFNTPKVALLSHGSEKNLTKYYTNCHVVREDVSCAPCHRLHYSKDTCPLVPEMQHPICMGLLHPKKLIPPIEEVYKQWKNNNLNGD
jgi:ADP-heptose:LPS heptosyltransferase